MITLQAKGMGWWGHPLCVVSETQMDPGVWPGVCNVDIRMLLDWPSRDELPNSKISPSLARWRDLRSTPHCRAATAASASPTITWVVCNGNQCRQAMLRHVIMHAFMFTGGCIRKISIDRTSMPSSSTSFNPSSRISRPPTIARGSFPPVWSKCRWVKNEEHTCVKAVDQWEIKLWIQ